ncbi:MAG: S-layer homology domain-containing protein [Oscillospiraceae bacterium]|nr:S-layer homology domain-containing protein [Oscillospiraceae bacterium]
MRNLKKLLALMLATAMVLSVGSIASANTIEDAPDADASAALLAQYGDLEKDYAGAVQFMLDLEIVKGDAATGELHLALPYTRVQFAALLYISQNGGKSIPAVYTTMQPYFSDISSSHWGYGYANWAGVTGLFEGTGENQLAPDKEITLVEGLLAVMKALGLRTDLEGIDGLSWDGAAQRFVISLAYELGLFKNLMTLDADGILNRAEAFLLNQYYIESEQIRYSFITGARYRTGPDASVDVWGADPGANVSQKLIYTQFGLATSEMTVLADGAWINLSGGSADRSGKALVNNVAKEGAAVNNAALPLSVAVTEKLGFGLEDIGHTFKVTYAHKSGDIEKVYGEAVQLTKDLSFSGKNRATIQAEMRDKTGASSGFASPAYDKWFLNYRAPITEFLALKGEGLDSWVAGGYLFDITIPAAIEDAAVTAWRSEDDTWGLSANTVAALNSAYKRLGFALWWNALSASDRDSNNGTAAPNTPGVIATEAGFDMSEDRFDNVNFRVVYDNDNAIKYVFAEIYTFGKVKEIDGDSKLQMNLNAAGIGGAETKNIYGIDAKESWASNTRVAAYRIGGAKWGIVELEQLSGKITEFTGDTSGDQTLVLAGSTLRRSNTINGIKNQGGGVIFSLALVTQEGTAYLLNGRMAEWVQDTDTPPDSYALVTKSQVIGTTGSITGGSLEYWVQLMLDDGTAENYQVKAVMNPGSQTLGGSGNNVTAGNVLSLNYKLFGYVVGSDNLVTLHVPGNYVAETPNSATVASLETGTVFNNAVFGPANTKYIVPATVTYISLNGGTDWKVYKGQTIPKITVTAGTNYVNLITRQTFTANDTASVVALRFGGADLPDDVSSGLWAVALGQPTTISGGQTIDVLTPSGKVTLTCEGTLFTAARRGGGTGLVKGILFDYEVTGGKVTQVVVGGDKAGTFVSNNGGNRIGGINVDLNFLVNQGGAQGAAITANSRFFNIDTGEVLTKAEAAGISFNSGGNPPGLNVLMSNANVLGSSNTNWAVIVSSSAIPESLLDPTFAATLVATPSADLGTGVTISAPTVSGDVVSLTVSGTTSDVPTAIEYTDVVAGIFDGGPLWSGGSDEKTHNKEVAIVGIKLADMLNAGGIVDDTTVMLVQRNNALDEMYPAEFDQDNAPGNSRYTKAKAYADWATDGLRDDASGYFYFTVAPGQKVTFEVWKGNIGDWILWHPIERTADDDGQYAEQAGYGNLLLRIDINVTMTFFTP